MDKLNKKLGFGFMRLPMIGEDVDTAQVCEMVDIFIANGFNYFDTAHGYIGGKSELAIRECLTSRYSRDKYILANKLSTPYFNSNEEIRPFFEDQLKVCGVEYFDFYLMHSQTSSIYEKFKKCRAYETAIELKNEGKIRHLAISFHDSAQKLDEILTEYPQIEAVQIQFNYLDYESPAIQSKAVYEVCRRHNKPVIIMEPVKGGSLVNLPEKAQMIFNELRGGSNAEYALRFAAGFEGVVMTLSGMSNVEQLKENISFMKDFVPLNDKEHEAVVKVRQVFNSMNTIPCTACRYCIDGCPQGIAIPDLFSVMNTKQIYKNWNADYYYNHVYTKNNGKASACIECGACEEICPQHLDVRKLLKDVANEFEK